MCINATARQRRVRLTTAAAADAGANPVDAPF